MEESGERRKSKGNRTSLMLQAVQLFFLLVGLAIIIKIMYLQFVYKPTPLENRLFGTPDRVDTLYPVRGSIYDCKDRLIASSVPMYNISMDCSVCKEEFKNNNEKEFEWREKARNMSYGLAQIIGGNSGDWYSRIIKNRNEGKHYMKIADGVDYQTVKRLQSLPLFNEGKNRSGLIVTSVETRQYPYGSLGRRAIGVVVNNRDRSRTTGLEDKFNKELHGEEGWTKMANTDRGVYVSKNRWNSRKVKNGLDVRSTLDMNIQDLADKALRNVMSENSHITGGCFLVMEVETGAIRAMVNLKKAPDGSLGELYNYALTQATNPGSVFKTATLMAAMGEKGLRLSDSIPCQNGIYTYKGVKCPLDKHVTKDYYPSGYITVGEGLKISSNHVFRYIGGEKFGRSPSDIKSYEKALDKYNLFADLDFDINGLAKCSYKDPLKSGETLTLPMIAMGYDMSTTPLHILTFYNAIANRGKQMKPYMIEALMKDGRTVKEFGPQVLCSSICSKETADSLKSALLRVTSEEHGTAYWRFRGAKCQVAGKTGTAFQTVTNPNTGKVSYSVDGARKIQGTFAGFFPAEHPRYTVVCVIYTDLTHDNIEGSRCASAVREVADALWATSPEWNEGIKGGKRMPKVTKNEVVTGEKNPGKVPLVTGLGLSDAIYSLESCGYQCVYEGHGKVVHQSPEAGKELKSGSTVVLKLK